MKKYLLLFLILPVLFLSACSTKLQESEVNNQIIVGGDKDNHGCIASAGYSWCEAKQKCLRIWEEKCDTLIEEFGIKLNIVDGFEIREVDNEKYLLFGPISNDGSYSYVLKITEAVNSNNLMFNLKLRSYINPSPEIINIGDFEAIKWIEPSICGTANYIEIIRPDHNYRFYNNTCQESEETFNFLENIINDLIFI